jgi:hypothetical protein
MTTHSRRALSERIAARATPAQRRRHHRAQFLKVLPSIRAALGEGWSVRAVWETLHAEGSISFGYDALLDHLAKGRSRTAKEPTR